MTIFLGLGTTAASAKNKGSLDIGYKVEDSTTKNLNVHQKWSWEPEGKDFQIETETNLYKTQVAGKDLTNRSDGEYEFILNFTPTHYGIANFGFNHNENRDIGEFRPHTGIGWGWKFFRNDRWKMSHEVTLTQMGTEEYSELVWRNSTWVRYQHPDSKWSFTNKYLFENGSNVHELTKNEMIISLLAKELFEKVKIILCPTFREESGLAMSSRNLRLEAKYSKETKKLFELLTYCKKNFDVENRKKLEQICFEKLSQFSSPEYFEIRQSVDLTNEGELSDKWRAFTATKFGDIRLIDNIALN